MDLSVIEFDYVAYGTYCMLWGFGGGLAVYFMALGPWVCRRAFERMASTHA